MNPEADLDYFSGASVVRETDRSQLVRFRDGREAWIPRSLSEWTTTSAGGPPILTVETWFSRKEGLK